jgi:hypothetical protein
MFKFLKSKQNIITFEAELIHDFEDELIDFQLVSTSIGPRLDVCSLFINQRPERIDGMFPQTTTEEVYTYKVIIKKFEAERRLIIYDQSWNYHFVQTIDEDNILLACARSYFYSQDKYDLNAKVFDNNSKLVREFLLGDGIQDLKVTEDNHIWTSYFDEGIFGNYGWDEPVGSCGLRSWDNNGNTKYKYPITERYVICDCYALNVLADDNVWFYYYTDFNLAHLETNKIKFYSPEISGSDGFIIYHDYVLFRGGYDDKNTYELFQIKGDRLKKIFTVFIRDENNNKLIADWVDCRGSTMLIQSGSKCYFIDLQILVSRL